MNVVNVLLENVFGICSTLICFYQILSAVNLVNVFPETSPTSLSVNDYTLSDSFTDLWCFVQVTPPMMTVFSELSKPTMSEEIRQQRFTELCTKKPQNPKTPKPQNPFKDLENRKYLIQYVFTRQQQHCYKWRVSWVLW